MGLLQADGCIGARIGRLLTNDETALFTEVGPKPKVFVRIPAESVFCVWSVRGAV